MQSSDGETFLSKNISSSNRTYTFCIQDECGDLCLNRVSFNISKSFEEENCEHPYVKMQVKSPKPSIFVNPWYGDENVVYYEFHVPIGTVAANYFDKDPIHFNLCN